MYWSFLEGLLSNETYYIENIKSTNFILGTYTKSMNIQIHELVTFQQTTKINTHEEQYLILTFTLKNSYWHRESIMSVNYQNAPGDYNSLICYITRFYFVLFYKNYNYLIIRSETSLQWGYHWKYGKNIEMKVVFKIILLYLTPSIDNVFLVQRVTCSLLRRQRHIKDTTDLDLRL
jgi:hypothetical protein